MPLFNESSDAPEMGWQRGVHIGKSHRYPATDYIDAVGELHLDLCESAVLARKYGVPLEGDSSRRIQLSDIAPFQPPGMSPLVGQRPVEIPPMREYTCNM